MESESSGSSDESSDSSSCDCCAHCGDEAIVGECAACGQFAYCSNECMQEHWWIGDHQYECVGALSDDTKRKWKRRAGKLFPGVKKLFGAGETNAKILKGRGKANKAGARVLGRAAGGVARFTFRKPKAPMGSKLLKKKQKDPTKPTLGQKIKAAAKAAWAKLKLKYRAAVAKRKNKKNVSAGPSKALLGGSKK